MSFIITVEYQRVLVFFTITSNSISGLLFALQQNALFLYYTSFGKEMRIFENVTICHNTTDSIYWPIPSDRDQMVVVTTRSIPCLRLLIAWIEKRFKWRLNFNRLPVTPGDPHQGVRVAQCSIKPPYNHRPAFSCCPIFRRFESKFFLSRARKEEEQGNYDFHRIIETSVWRSCSN